MAEMSPLRRRMIEDMTIRNLSPATQRSYLHAVTKSSAYFGRSPDRLSHEDVRTYQVHLAGKGVAWATLNQVVCALRFFYGVTLGDEAAPERIAYARTPKSLPVILSGEEVPRFLEAVSSLKCRVWERPIAMIYSLCAWTAMLFGELYSAVSRSFGPLPTSGTGSPAPAD